MSTRRELAQQQAHARAVQAIEAWAGDKLQPRFTMTEEWKQARRCTCCMCGATFYLPLLSGTDAKIIKLKAQQTPAIPFCSRACMDGFLDGERSGDT